MTSISRLIASAVLAISTAAFADDGWTLTTDDFQTKRVAIESMTEKALNLRALPAQQPTEVSLERFLQLDRNSTSEPAGDVLTLYFTNGDRLTGKPLRMEGEKLVWSSSAGEISAPMRSLQGITRGPRAPNREGAIEEDIAELANGDRVRGIVSKIGEQTVSLDSSGAAVDVPLESIAVLHFATMAQPAPSTERAYRIRLRDGSILTAASLRLSDGTFSFQYAGAERKAPIDSVSAIEQINGPVSWLSSRQPSETIQTPFLEMTWPTRFDRNVQGEPIRFASRTFARGIGVHAYSKLVFPLGGGYDLFRTQYAIDGDQPYADVTVRIKLDDKVVHELKNFKSGVLAPVVSIDCKGAQNLTLEVDYGSTYDVQDRFNWIEPALLRK